MKLLTQFQRVYRLLNGLISPVSTRQISIWLDMPMASVRRVLSDFRALDLIETTPIGVRLAR